MGVVAAVAAVIGLGAAAYSVYEQNKQMGRAQDASEEAAKQQKKILAEQQAQEAAKAAQERRRLVREERVRRAKILQGAENAGVAQSSGPLGATSALSTNLGSALGFNLGEVSRGQRISGLMDSTAEYQMQSQAFQNSAAMWGSIGSLGSSIFSSAGGFGAISTGFGLGKK